MRRGVEGGVRRVRRGVEGGGRRSEGGERGERREGEGRGGYTSRGRARARGRAAGRERINSPFLRSFDPRAARLASAKIMQKKFFADGATWGKIRKNPNKIGVFGVQKKKSRGGAGRGTEKYNIRDNLGK